MFNRENIKDDVYKLLANDESGHDYDHVLRTNRLAIKFAKEEKENNSIINEDVVSLIALLHDVDDYKIFGKTQASKLTNAKMIMKRHEIDNTIQKQVVKAIKTMGYSNYLKGIRPESIEGQIVSDADMCDSLGAIGILRLFSFSKEKGNGVVFNRNIFPNEVLTYEEYTRKKMSNNNSVVNKFFERSFILKDIMFTKAGEKEAAKRHKIEVDFLRQLFYEEEAYEWIEYLDNYILTKNIEQ